MKVDGKLGAGRTSAVINEARRRDVRVFPQRAKDKGLQTLVTSGLIGHDSSASATLQQFLENRLVQRLDMGGRPYSN